MCLLIVLIGGGAAEATAAGEKFYNILSLESA